MFGLNNAFTSLKWSTLILATVFTVFALVFSTPESQVEALSKVGLHMQTSMIDTPFILTILWILWFMFIMSQTSWKMLKVASDRIIMAGIDRPESCICSELDKNKKGDLGFIRVGGAKLLPDIEGTSVWIAPLTHIHKIASTIWIEAYASPNVGLDEVPPEIKMDIYQRRHGIFGIKDCSPGYLSPQEMQQHTGFDGKDYENASKEDQTFWTTSTFITDIVTRNKAISVLFDYFGDDTSPIERKLASIRRIGAAANQQEKKGLLDNIMFGGD